MEVENRALLETRAFINGKWLSSDDKFEVVNPATGRIESVQQIRLMPQSPR